MKLKNILATAAIAIVSVASANAEMPYNQGDLILGVYSDTATPVYEFNLGAGATFAGYTSSHTVTVSLGNDLKAAFGINWFTDSTLHWVIAGSNSGTTTVNVTDTIKTSYFGLAEITLGTKSIAPVPYSKTSIGVLASLISNATTGASGFINMTPVSGGVGAQDVNTNAHALSSKATFVDSNNGFNNWFGTGIDITGNLTQAIDLYRYLGNQGTPTTKQTPSYEGSFTLDDTGTVKYFESPLVIPEPSTYAMLVIGATGCLGYLRRRSIKA